MTECENSATLVTLASKVPNATPLCSAEALDPGSSRICATVHEDHVTWTLSLCQRVTKFCRQKEKKTGLLATIATVMCSPMRCRNLCN